MPITKFRPQLFGTTGDPISYDVKHAESLTGGDVISGDEAVEKWIQDMKRINEDRRAGFIYHAFGNFRGDWTIDALTIIYDQARRDNLALAVWENPESGIQIVCVRDPDTSVDSGWDLYQALDKPNKLFQSYGCAHYMEWESYGFVLDVSQDPTPNVNRGSFRLTALDGHIVDIW